MSAASMAVLPWSALATTIVGLTSGLFQSSNTNKQVQASLDAQHSANATNIYLQQEQNKWNAEQIAKQNEYNSPLQQRLRYELAGMNPLLAGMQQGLQPAAAQGQAAQVQSAAPILLEAAALKNQAINSMFDNALKASQSELAKAQAKAESDKNARDADLHASIKQMYEKQIDLFGWQVTAQQDAHDLSFEQQNYTYELAKKTAQETQNLRSTWRQIQQQYRLGEQQFIINEKTIKAAQNELDAYWKRFDVELNKMIAEANLSNSEAAQVRESIGLVKEQITAQRLANLSSGLDLSVQYYSQDARKRAMRAHFMLSADNDTFELEVPPEMKRAAANLRVFGIINNALNTGVPGALTNVMRFLK